jgi:hypothetical protein
MIDNTAILILCRTTLLGITVRTTGVTTLTATGNGYTRAAGSFITDGFVPGQEVVPVGFTTNTVGIIKKVEALTLTTEGRRNAETAATDRSLTVGIPPYRAWDNVAFDPKLAEGRWYVEEEYFPGPQYRISATPQGEFEHTPTYVIKYYGLPNEASIALYAIGLATLLAFKPGKSLGTIDGRSLDVREDVAPAYGAIVNLPGRAILTVNIPLRVRSQRPE